LRKAAVWVGVEDIAELEHTLGPEAREEGIEGCSDAEMGNLAQEIGAVVFLLDWICLRSEILWSVDLYVFG
jgi:hypothetical protein